MLFIPEHWYTYRTVVPSTTARPAAAQGTSVTPATGAKGSWADLMTNTAYDAYGIRVMINSNSGSAASRNTVVDIGVDENNGSSYEVRIPNLIGGNASPHNIGDQTYYFPLFIPKGSAIAARAYGSVATAFYVYIELVVDANNMTSEAVAAYVEAIGVSTYVGTSVTAGTTSEGSWTSLGATTKNLWYWDLGVQIATSDTSHNAAVIHLDLAAGDGSNYLMLLEQYRFWSSTSEQNRTEFHNGMRSAFVPAGSTIYVRAQTSGTADPLRIVAYGAGG